LYVSLTSLIFYFPPYVHFHRLASYVFNLLSLYPSLFLPSFFSFFWTLYDFLSPSRMPFSSFLYYGFLPYFLLLSFWLLPSFVTCFSFYPLILYYNFTDCLQRHSHSHK
jgi:hypothetical protein